MTFGETRKNVLKTIEFPMSIGDIRIAAGIKYDTAKYTLEWLFSMGVIHSSRDPESGKLLYHRMEFRHPTMLYHLSMQEIEEKKKAGLLPESAGVKEAEIAELVEKKKAQIADNEQPSLEDVPARGYPEGEADKAEQTIEEE